MRISNVIGVCVIAFLVTIGISSSSLADPVQCVRSKIENIQLLTKENVSDQLEANFSIDALAGQAVGGLAKFNAKPEGEKATIRGLFSNQDILGELYDSLKKYKNVTKVVFRPIDAKTPNKVLAVITAGGINHSLTFTFIGKSCKLWNLCKKNICVSDLFRVNRSQAKAKPKSNAKPKVALGS